MLKDNLIQPLVRKWRLFRNWLTKRQHQMAMRTLVKDSDDDYQAYLDLQLERTLSKGGESNKLRAPFLIDAIVANSTTTNSVLCVGCRNTAELEYFRQKGAAQVVGIDIFSNSDDVLIMDMHDMSFDDSSFDVVYSSHSLEHSFDANKVTAEIIRVARDGAVVGVEVPIRFKAGGVKNADLVDFQSADGLKQYFAAHIDETFLCEEYQKLTDLNPNGSPIVRLVFRVRK